jgi:hypothetical protein
MNFVESYNFLDGNNLCNVFATLLVQKIENEVPDAKTEITVLNVRNFFLIKGKTTSTEVLNVADIFSDFLIKYSKEMSEKVRVIDLISYGEKIEKNNYVLNLSFNKVGLTNKFEGEKFVNSLINENIFLNIKVNHKDKTVLYGCENCVDEYVKQIISVYVNGYDIYPSDFSDEIYISDKYYGLSKTPEKYYVCLLRNVAYHLFSTCVSKHLDFEIVFDIPHDDINSENIKLSITNNDHITKKSWLESLILDIFPMDLKSLQSNYVINYQDDIDYIITSESPQPWLNLNMAKDIILL